MHRKEVQKSMSVSEGGMTAAVNLRREKVSQELSYIGSKTAGLISHGRITKFLCRIRCSL